MLHRPSKLDFLNFTLALSVVGSLVSLPSNAMAQAKIGTSAAVRGDVFVSTKGAERKAAVRDAIRLQDRVLTRDDSALQILLLDQSTFTVGQNCSMIIDRFVYDPDTSVGKVSAKVAKGAFRFMSGRIGQNNPTNASVSTPSATIGIRGTFLEGIVGLDAIILAQLGGIEVGNGNPENASISVLRGPGKNRNTLDRIGVIEVSNAAGSVTLTEPNYAVFTSGQNSAPIGPFKVTRRMHEYLDFFLRPPPNGPGEDPLNLLSKGSKESRQNRFNIPAAPSDDVVNRVQEGITDPNVLIEQEEPEPEIPETPTIPEDPEYPKGPTSPPGCVATSVPACT